MGKRTCCGIDIWFDGCEHTQVQIQKKNGLYLNVPKESFVGPQPQLAPTHLSHKKRVISRQSQMRVNDRDSGALEVRFLDDHLR